MRDAHPSNSFTASALKAGAVFHAPMSHQNHLPNALAGDSELGESGCGESFDELRDNDRPQEECGVFGIFAPGVDVAGKKAPESPFLMASNSAFIPIWAS